MVRQAVEHPFSFHGFGPRIFMRIAVRAVPSKLAPQPPCSGCASVPRWRVVWFRPAFDVGKVQTGGIAKRE